MKKQTLFQSTAGTITLSLLLLASPQAVFAKGETDATPDNTYSSLKTVILKDGSSVAVRTANSPSRPPAAMMTAKSTPRSPALKAGDIKISDVPAFDWSYGSSATAGAMIAGYYDRVGFIDMYTGPTNGGCMPLTNAGWGSSDKGGNECPLSATRQGVDGRNSRGHVDDYYVAEGNSGPDPYDTVPKWEEHKIGDCTGDYMKTSKWFPGSSNDIPGVTEDINRDGSAVFIYDITGAPMTAAVLESNTLNRYDAGYGLKLFFESRGYTVETMYNQFIHPFEAAGFTYDQYKAEIDAGRPVMLHLSGHIVVGTGYNDSTDNEIIFHDSWSHLEHTMIWGGVYNTLFTHDAVTIVTLADAINPDAKCRTDFPWAMFLPAITGSK